MCGELYKFGFPVTYSIMTITGWLSYCFETVADGQCHIPSIDPERNLETFGNTAMVS